MIALVFVGDLKYCPYVKKYIEIILAEKKDYLIFFWNRGNYDVNTSYKYKFFEHQSDLSKGKVKKLFDFIHYAIWLNREIETAKPEKIVFLSTLSIMLMKPSLVKKYKTKYVLDIRDYSYEHHFFFRWQEQKYIRESFYCCISSPGFKNFLISDYQYLVAHNFDKNIINKLYKFKKIGEDKPLKIVWTGVMRYFDYQKNLIDALGNDQRFELHYYGSGPELNKYQSYAKKYNNIFIYGAYDNEHKSKLIDGANIINNCYGSSNKRLLKYAISNKYYDGIIFKLPQIVESGNYKARIVEQKGLGLVVDFSIQNFADFLYNYYHNINAEDFNKSCCNELETILIDDKKYENELKRFFCE